MKHIADEDQLAGVIIFKPKEDDLLSILEFLRPDDIAEFIYQLQEEGTPYLVAPAIGSHLLVRKKVE